MAVKIFQIGFNKCGTRTIHQFLKKQGFRAVHWDDGNLAKAMYRNLANGVGLLTGYERFEVFTDMELITHEFVLEGFKLFPYLAREFPDARFILNTRDREDWIKSRLSHGGGNYLKKWRKVTDKGEMEALADLWRADWDHHHARVTEFFADQPKRFVKFDITDSPQVIADLLPEHDIDLSHYSHVGRTKDKRRNRAADGKAEVEELAED